MGEVCTTIDLGVKKSEKSLGEGTKATRKAFDFTGLKASMGGFRNQPIAEVIAILSLNPGNAHAASILVSPIFFVPFVRFVVVNNIQMLRSTERNTWMNYPQLIPEHIKNLIDWNDPNDPLRKQFVYDQREDIHSPGESDDPLREAEHSPVPGLIHKYRNRVLWLVTDRCPVHCRFCFRRCRGAQADEPGSVLVDERIHILEYIRSHMEIDEVILSGGDPFMLDTGTLRTILLELAAIPHVRMLRIHTRFPVAVPGKFTPKMIDALNIIKILRIVLHINHPREISGEFIEVVKKLRESGIILLAQTVLLTEVNDNVDLLRRLFLELAALGIQPYYLHELDPVIGSGHFRVNRDDAMTLYSKLMKCLPGHALPRYVADVPGRDSKTFFSPSS